MTPYLQQYAANVNQIGLNFMGEKLSNKTWEERADKQAEYNKELMQYQYQLQEDSIDKMNLYNSPVEQMKRYSEAGLNPNLIYNQGNNGNQTTTAKPSSSAPANYQKPVQDLTRGVEFFKQAIQIQDMLNKTKESSARAHMMQTQARLYDTQALSDNFKRNYLLPLYQYEQELKNIGLGYDNSINWWRGQYLPYQLRSELEYQDSRNLMAITDSALKDLELHSWYPMYNQAYRKGEQSINNMKAQYRLMAFERYGLQPLEYRGLKLRNRALSLSNDFDNWKYKHQKDTGMPFGAKNSYGFTLPLIGGGFNWSNYYDY